MTREDRVKAWEDTKHYFETNYKMISPMMEMMKETQILQFNHFRSCQI